MAAPGTALAVFLLLVLQQASAQEAQVWVGRYSTFWKNVASGETGVSAVGRNNYGQLGIDATLAPSCWSPVVLAGTDGIPVNGEIRDVVTGAFHTFFVLSSEIYGVGRNNHGQLGDGTTEDIAMPTSLHLGNLKSRLACGYAHCIYGRNNMEGSTAGLFTWGWNAQGQLGTGDTADKPSPVQLDTISVVGRSEEWFVFAGHDFSIAWSPRNGQSDTLLLVMGNNLGGQLGLGHRRSVLTAHATINTMPKSLWAPFFAAGNSHTHALFEYDVRGTGSNFAGQLGDGTTTPNDVFGNRGDQWTPTVKDDAMWSTGGDSSCYVDNTGNLSTSPPLPAGVYCAGDNTFGQIGMGGSATSLRFNQVGATWGSESVVGLSTGSYHSMLVTVYSEVNSSANRFVYGAGANGYGQLGDCRGNEMAYTFKSSQQYGGTTNAPGAPTPAPDPTPAPPAPPTTGAPTPTAAPTPPVAPTPTAAPTPGGTKAPSGGEGYDWTTVLMILVAGGIVVVIACVLANTGNSESVENVEMA